MSKTIVQPQVPAPLEVGHTPGPWRVDEYGVRDRGGYICEITWPTRFPDQNERYAEETTTRTADGRLIAAAPDLLEALSSAFEMIEMCSLKFAPSALEARRIDVAIYKIRAAIAKAEGKS